MCVSSKLMQKWSTLNLRFELLVGLCIICRMRYSRLQPSSLLFFITSAGNMEDDLQHKILDCDPLTANVYEVEKDDTSYSDIDEGGSMPNGKESASYKHKQPSQKESKSVVCEVCGKILQSRKLLRTHEKREHHLHPSKRYRCLICNEAFSLCNDLHTHLATHSINDHEALKCKLCDVYLSASSSLISHLFEHHKKFACDVCGKKFLTTRSFQLHKKFHMEQFPCQVCNRVLRTASKLKDHMNRHTGEKPYECEVCHMRLPSISALENHKTRVHKEVGVKCLICEKTFKTTFARNSHYMEHTEEERNHHSIVVKMFTCEVCGKIVRDEYKATHLESHKSRHDRARVCEICGKEFLQLSWLKLHIKLHHKSGQGIVRSVAKEELVTEELLKYVCDICGKRFAYQSTLATHRVVHSDDRPYTCFCGKTFKLKGQLKQHEIIHTGNEPYKCDVCGKGFTIRGTYVSHMRTHSSEKPFACHVCGAKFNQRKNMVRHVSSVHDKERRFKCDVCGKGFNVKSSLQVHYRIHTGEKPYTCHICGHAFSDPSTFHKHKAIHAKKSSKAEVLANLAESNKDVMNS